MKCFWKNEKKNSSFGDFFTIKNFFEFPCPQKSTNQLKRYFLCAK